MAILQAKQSGSSAQDVSMEARRETGPTEEPDAEKGAFPTSLVCIVGTEFCERFAYKGMSTVLALYFMDHLHQSEEQATEFLHLFIVACYMTPLLGAFISDSYIGKYRTILYLSLVYCLGNWAMAASALHSQASHSASLTILGLGLIAFGTGGIKPCVSAFGGDQIELSYPPSSARNTLLRRFFSAFYFSINAGAVLSTLITPMIRSYSSYTWAFAVPAWLMMLSLVLFYLGSGSYKHQPPGGNVVAHVAGVIWTAIRLNTQRGQEQPALPEAETQAPEQPQKAPRPPQVKVPQSKPIGIGGVVRFSNFIGGNSLRTASIFLRGTPPETRPEQQALLSGADSGPESGSSVRGGNNIPVPRPPSRRNLAGEIGAQALPPAGPPVVAARSAPSGGVQAGQVAKRHWLDAAKAVHGSQDVEDVKGLLKVLLLFVPAPLFWSLFDQQSSRWVFQARKLDGRLPFGLVIEPDQMQVLNAMFILIMIPLFDRGIYPFLERRGVSLRPIRRMVVGMFIAAVAFVLSAFLQIALDHGSPEPAEGLTSSLGAFGGNGTMGLGSGQGFFGGSDLAGWGKGGHAGKGGHGGEHQRLSMLWQVPQYVVLTAGEILFSITGLELAYSQAPSNMTAVVQSAWLLSVAAGNLVTVLVVGIIGNRLSLANEFFFFAGGCIVAMLALKFVGRGFEYAGARQPRKESSSGPVASPANQDVEQGLH